MVNTLTLDPEKWYTTGEVVQLAKQGYSPFRSLNTLYGLIHTGQIEVVARGSKSKVKYFIQGKELVRFSESQRVTISKKHGEQQNQKSSDKASEARNISNTSREG